MVPKGPKYLCLELVAQCLGQCLRRLVEGCRVVEVALLTTTGAMVSMLSCHLQPDTGRRTANLDEWKNVQDLRKWQPQTGQKKRREATVVQTSALPLRYQRLREEVLSCPLWVRVGDMVGVELG